MSTPAWPNLFSREAQREGWNIFECYGSVHGTWQVCKVDDPEEGDTRLESDDEAWRIVMEGLGSHHCAARELVRAHNPEEFERMTAWMKGGLLHADVVLDPAEVDERLSVRIGNLFIEIGPRDVPGATVRVFDARLSKPEEIAVLQIEEPA